MYYYNSFNCNYSGIEISFMHAFEYGNTCSKGIFTFPSCCNCYVWDLDVVNCKMETMDIREHFRRIKQWKIHWKHKEYKKFLFPLAPPRKIVKSWINWSMLSSFYYHLPILYPMFRVEHKPDEIYGNRCDWNIAVLMGYLYFEL